MAVALTGAAAVFGAAGPNATHEASVSLNSLLNEMTDLRALAEFASPAFTCRQFSSFDRASATPGDVAGWFANDDRDHFLRTIVRGERIEFVMMDAAGPGAIVRMWSANPEGTLRIYLDDAPEAVIELPMAEYLGGEWAHAPSPVAGRRALGWNSYLPVPYSRHCVVTTDRPGSYYHLNYRTYEAGTRVETLTARRLADAGPRIREVAQALERAGRPARAADDPAAKFRHVELMAGEEASIPVDGALAVCGLEIRLLTAEDRTQALRHMVLSMDFDGRRTVESPLGDFFGTSPGESRYRSLPMGIDRDGTMWSAWFMPQRERGEIRLRNHGAAPVTLEVRAWTTPYAWHDRSLYFHAAWTRAARVPTMPRRDWTIADVRGPGVYVGTAMFIANPVRAWWGEGDEKIYVDGERFPSHFGTGTEDYFGYAWCANTVFQHAYHNQPRSDGPASYGHSAVNRWHILDRIPFRECLRFDMEVWHWTPSIELDLGAVAYWYAAPGAAWPRAPLSHDDLALTLIAPYEPVLVRGAIEGEGMRILESTGTANAQFIDGCSDDHHLWWRGAKPGEQLVLGFASAAEGPHRVLARFVKAPDYGVFDLSVNSEPMGPPVSFYAARVELSAEMDLGVFHLRQGLNRFAAEYAAGPVENPAGAMLGLDYLRLAPERAP